MRLIAGSAGGRRLAVAPGSVTRPTTDRSRSAVLCHHVLGSAPATGRADPPRRYRFCDLYAGSGAMGPEAASRGANPVLLVEADRRIAALAVRNARELGLPAKVHVARRGPAPAVNAAAVRHPLRRSAVRHGQHLDDQLMAILLGGWIKPRGLVSSSAPVGRRTSRGPLPSGPRARTYGETVVEFGAVDSLRATEGEL